MGASKKHPKNGKPPLQMRSRTTRSKGRILSDPAQNTQLLTEQLRSLGLYAANTLGDGNCLFRALCDQLYGSPSQHLQLRKDICDWIESHSQRYEPFCEDERGLSAHLRCMREQGTYGGHLELSAFAHFTRRNVKVIQPGLVYVIEWAAGGDMPFDRPASAQDDDKLNEREIRRLRRQHQRDEPIAETSGSDPSVGAVYVAYHDWEHFSSIRNLRGPHSGVPLVSELPADAEVPVPPSASKKPISKAKAKPESKSVLKRSRNGQFAKIKVEDATPPTPAQIPLPASRSPSPLSSSDYLDHVDIDPLPTIPVALMPPHLSSLSNSQRIHRSPKRSFDESSGTSTSETIAKRTRSSRRSPSRTRLHNDAIDVDEADSTPGLSTPGSSAGSTRSSSSASPLPSTPPPASMTPPPEPERTLTRRQRKALGLPKPRSVLAAKKASAGKIVIPGGRYKKGVTKATSVVKEADDENEDGEGGIQDEEWRRNGTGRVDVRGFRELKI
ncbi:cysteine proteinase [Leucogyrophana mollusca]|uniref:Cysteine proteinase n=1 Tax=Leucogyrophana mollusca TaxID=85980 RepID=A0ACB8BG10_9AGAM|nr:cysteine proteinase [Leucogyrophana mollusca]